MNIFKKGCMTLLGVTLISTQLVACGSTTDTPKASESGKAKPVEITWWNFPSFQALDGEVGKYEKQLIAAFNKKNPDIKVNLEMLTYEAGPEKLNVAIASNTAPDVIYDAPGRILDWGKKDLLAPLNDMITDEVKKDVSPALMKQSMVGDQVYMYPINTAPFMMGINKTIFEKIGALDLLPLNKPDRTWTFDEYKKALEAVKEKAPDVIPSGFFAKSQGGDQGTRAYIANLSNSSFFNDDYSKVAINTDKAGAALDWIAQGVKDKLVVSGAESLTGADVNDLFLQGKLAVTLNYSPVLKAQNATLKKAKFDDVLVPFPTIDGAAPKLEPYLGGMAVFNNGDQDKIAASKKLVDFIANDPEWGKKNLIQTGGLSARNSITGLYNDPEYTYAELARKFYGNPPTVADGYAEIRTYWFPELQRVLIGQATGKQALDSFAEKADAAITKAKAALKK
ncbi:multiple sugar transport system substrate-binding protein [Paenibacillus shirakamiensis]|uniref:Multiple sugar transport system substrate-binding protein n=1 Tax=Paenibacillus shirakamiensis TaxID=1265935 RepID=A0ABS4JKJ0_9BACL|nr:extracellular solute-binding protein [Paenibacillus shirakamiensis]MBP2002227.1 multiple sugar transport system substrate-binding protein [Paenibacillus shirakamiensis]